MIVKNFKYNLSIKWLIFYLLFFLKLTHNSDKNGKMIKSNSKNAKNYNFSGVNSYLFHFEL